MAIKPKKKSKSTTVSRLGFPLKTNAEIFPSPTDSNSFRDIMNAVGVNHAFLARQILGVLLGGGPRADALSLAIAQKLYPKDLDPDYVEPKIDFINMTNEEAAEFLMGN